MTYMPIKTSGRVRTQNKTGTMPVFGVNWKDDSQLLDTRSALLIENYLVHGTAKMQKRPGQVINFDTTESSVITLSGEYVNDYDIIAYGQKVRAFNNVDGTFTNIKTDFTANNSGFSGGKYGDYFFVNTFQDGLWRISRTIAYDGQTFNFTVGEKITGGTSGATAYVLEDADGGTTGTLTLGSIVGTFADNETLTGSVTGVAIANGSAGFSITAVSNAPKCRKFGIIGKRGICIGLATDESGYNYSNSDTGINPPFNVYAENTGYDDPGTGGYRRGGAANDVALIGAIIFVGQQNGWYAFSIEQTDISGVSSKFDKDQGYREDFPVYRCVTTNAGMFINTTSGLKRLVSLGQNNVPFSDQWEALTSDLGGDYWKKTDFSDSDIIYDELREFVYTTFRKSSEVNNTIAAVKVDQTVGVQTSVKTGATSILTGWNVEVFMSRGNDIYATSSLDGIRHKLFVGQKDVQRKIHSTYLQELSFGLTSAFNLEEFYAKGELSPVSNLEISFDTFDRTGYYKVRRRRYGWMSRYTYSAGAAGWGVAGWGTNGWGGGATLSGLIPDFTGAKPLLREWTRIYLRIESDDYAEHILNWFSANVTEVAQVRNRQLERIT